MKKVLLIGGSSIVGSHLLHYLSHRYRIIVTYHKNPVRMPDVISLPLDLTNKESVEKLIQALRPDVVIYTAMNQHLEYCQQHGRLGDLVNNQAPVHISYACQKRQIKLVFISSCFVFSGEFAPYREKDQPKPLNNLGNSLTSAEYSIQKNCSRYLILRCSPVWGRTIGLYKQGFLDYLEQQWSQGAVSKVDHRIRTGFVSGYLLAKIIFWCIEKSVENRILHVNSSDYLTQYEFACLLAKQLKVPSKLVAQMDEDFPIDDNKRQFVRKVFDFSCSPENLSKLMKTKLPTVAEQIKNYWELLDNPIHVI